MPMGAVPGSGSGRVTSVAAVAVANRWLAERRAAETR
jgi:hypothetical protein